MKIEFNENIKIESIDEQIKKMYEEFQEVCEEVCIMALNYEKKEDINQDGLGLEIFDFMQAGYTFLKNMYTKESIIDLNKKHIEKLKKRGF